MVEVDFFISIYLIIIKTRIQIKKREGENTSRIKNMEWIK